MTSELVGELGFARKTVEFNKFWIFENFEIFSRQSPLPVTAEVAGFEPLTL
jgi:hypothetical protein